MTSKAQPPKDRRVLRTRRTLRDALVQLILQRGWEQISVLDICERADVGRSTFYTHFADKEELLLSGFDDLRAALRKQHPPAGPAGTAPLAFAGTMIEHASENLRLFRALVGKRSGHAVQKRFRALILDLVSEDLAALHLPGRPALGPVHFLTGAFIELLSWWLDTRTMLTHSDLEQLFHDLSAPVLATLSLTTTTR